MKTLSPVEEEYLLVIKNAEKAAKRFVDKSCLAVKE